MLETIKNFIMTLFQPILSLFDLIISFVQDIVYVVKLVGAFVVNIPSYFDWLPSGVVALIVSIFAVVVIYKILGRE